MYDFEDFKNDMIWLAISASVTVIGLITVFIMWKGH